MTAENTHGQEQQIDFTAGRVYLVGAGPGDVELLTLKAARILSEADLVLVDDLVNKEVLKFCKPNVEIAMVGKRGGRESAQQSEIIARMIEEAERGKCIVRLKGGDPFIFGRGGEEILALLEAGIEVEPICGVTSGMAAAANIGISLTHRQYSSGVTFVAGCYPPESGQINWKAISETGTTIVIYMGMANLAAITQELVSVGMDPYTPSAVIENGTHESERTVLAPVCKLAAAAESAGLKSPAIIVIGNVVRLAEIRRLWHDNEIIGIPTNPTSIGSVNIQ